MSTGKKSLSSHLVSVLLITLVASTAGGGAGWFLLQWKPDLLKTEKPAATATQERIGPSLEGLVPMPIPTIITNLAGPGRVWVRLEFSVLLPVKFKRSDALAAQISQDTIIFLRTLELEQIEGPLGLSFLREDIEERVRTRIGDEAKGILFSSFIVE